MTAPQVATHEPFGFDMVDAPHRWRAICRECDYTGEWLRPLDACDDLQQHFDSRHRP